MTLSRSTGVGKSRNRGAHETTGELLIFLDSNTLVTEGWLEPLLELVTREPTTIAVPHYDNINDPVSYEYLKTNLNLITGARTRTQTQTNTHADADTHTDIHCEASSSLSTVFKANSTTWNVVSESQENPYSRNCGCTSRVKSRDSITHWPFLTVVLCSLFQYSRGH